MSVKYRLLNKKIYVSAIVLVILLLILYRGGVYKPVALPHASKGVINLENWDSSKGSSVTLDGQWELYWGQLLTPKDFTVNNNLSARRYIEIPGSLTSSINKLPGLGYGTMRLKIRTKDNLKNGMMYGIRTEYILSASNIWVNGVLVSSVGTVGKSEREASGSYERQMAFFNSKGKEIEIVIQMSNFNNIAGKIKSIFLGSNKQIKRDYIKSLTQDAFIIGCLFIMGIYHLILYYKRRKYKAALYFGLFCILTAIRNILVGQRLVFEILPNIPFDIFNKLAYLSLYCLVPFAVMFFKEVFAEKFSMKLVKFVNVASLAASILTILFNIEVYGRFLIFYEIIVIIVIANILLVSLNAAIHRSQTGLVVLIGFSVFTVAIIHDMLVQAGRVYTPSLSPTGLLFFVLLESYMLASDFSKAYNDIEQLVEANKAVFIDELTEILNRRGFYERGSKLFDAALITGGRFIVYYGDLNKFKNINDSFGHKEGDAAIKVTAEIIKSSFGKDDIVARMSGDEFIIIAVNKTLNDAKSILARVNNNFDKYNSTSNKPYKLSICFGYSVFQGNLNVSFDELIHEADRMLYQEKKSLS